MARHYPTLTRNGFLLPSNIKASYEGAGEGRRSASWEATDNGITVQQGPSLYDIGDITALEESLQQSDRYLALED